VKRFQGTGRPNFRKQIADSSNLKIRKTSNGGMVAVRAHGDDPRRAGAVMGHCRYNIVTPSATINRRSRPGGVRLGRPIDAEEEDQKELELPA